MRWIQKQDAPPTSLAEFLEQQLPVGLNLDYESGFTRKTELRLELVREQFGLCGYTGAPVDERIGNIGTPPACVRIKSHIEHLKPQSVCRQELEESGRQPGRDLGEDMDHRNMIAALLVEGAQVEQFGAAARTNQPVPVWPTQPGCEERFYFEMDGSIAGRDCDASETIGVLKLNHNTLLSWRRAALDVFLSPDVLRTREDVENLVRSLDQPQSGRLVEYCFCIKNVAQAML